MPMQMTHVDQDFTTEVYILSMMQKPMGMTISCEEIFLFVNIEPHE